MIQGLYQLASTLMYSREKHSWIFLLYAFINLGTGIAALVYPHITVLFLIMLMGLTWLATGMLQIIAAFRLRKKFGMKAWLMLIGRGLHSLRIICLAQTRRWSFVFTLANCCIRHCVWNRFIDPGI